ncbi:unnamed protein product [Ascophyllum nodosum]
MTVIFPRRWGGLVLLLAVLPAAVCNGKEEPSVDEGDGSLTQLAEFKRRLHPDRSLAAWREEGFAFPEQRGPEFEALRVDKAESVHKPLRLDARGMSQERFSTIELNHQPLVIDNIPEVYDWKAASWTIPMLAEKFPTLNLRVKHEDKGPIKVPMADFARYVDVQKDDDPMLVFDDFIYNDEIGKTLMAQYTVPDIFSEDLWQLAKGHKNYPAYRWLLIGPKRSGSAPHNDPLGTSAWNTLITGRKLWFLAPPYFEDIVDNTDDVNVIKWFIEELPKLSAKYRDDFMMYVQHPGETMLVPSFWMHAVLNLDDTIAITQNFVSTHTFPEAWELARDHEPNFAQSWLQELVVHREDLGLMALRMNASKRRQMRIQQQMASDGEI